MALKYQQKRAISRPFRAGRDWASNCPIQRAFGHIE